MIFNQINIKSPSREVLLDISKDIDLLVKKSGFKEGVCLIFVPHTTAGILINENADPAVKKDILKYLKELIPESYGFSHLEGNSDAHIKSSLIGHSVSVLIHEGKLLLGTWQGIMFAEFDGPRNRKIFVQIIGE